MSRVDEPHEPVPVEAEFPQTKKKVAALLRQADENLSAPVEDDDDDVVDLTV